MSASITDKFNKAASGDGTYPTLGSVSATRNAGESVLACQDLTGWATETPVHFSTYRLDQDGAVDTTTQTDWKGIVSGNSITNLTRIAGAADTGNAIGDIVELNPTIGWLDDIITGLLVAHEQDGTLKNNSVTTAKITNLNVTTGKIANGAVTGVSNDASAVGSAKLALATVGTPNLRDNAVSSAKIADDAVTSSKVDWTTINTFWYSAKNGNPVTIPKDGIYDISAQTSGVGITSGLFVSVQYAGTSTWTWIAVAYNSLSSGSWGNWSCRKVLSLSSGDKVRVCFNSDGNILAENGEYSQFNIVEVLGAKSSQRSE